MRTKRRSAASGVDPRVYARGEKLRRQLAGAAYAKGADAGLDPALLPVRELLTEWIWGKIWTRPGIDRRTRSFMNIGILMALNRPHELAVNLGTALRNGLTREEIAEAILHAAGYCGVPAGVNSIAVARQVFGEKDVAQPTARSRRRDAKAPARARKAARGR